MAGNFHESYTGEDEVHGGSDRNFGLTVGGILVVLGLIRWIFGSGFGVVVILLCGIGLILMALAATAPFMLAPLNRAWTRLGLLLFKVVNPIVMLLIFATSIVPIGLIMRALGKDLLHLKRDQEAESYWIERHPAGPAPETMIHQF